MYMSAKEVLEYDSTLFIKNILERGFIYDLDGKEIIIPKHRIHKIVLVNEEVVQEGDEKSFDQWDV